MNPLMEILLLIFRLGLCAVFGAAALAKLADPEGTRRALASFGLPRGATKPLGRALPFAELAVAVALIPLASARWAALGALALLLIFTAAIGLSLARGNAPDCHCFGQLHSAPAGPSVLVRNLILAGAGGLIVWRGGGGLSATDWLFGLTPAERAQVILGLLSVFLLAAITALLVRILKRQGEMLERLEDLELSLERSESGAAVTRGDVAPLTAGLPVGAPAPEFILPSLDGAEVSLDALLAAGRPLLLLFVSPGCGPCASLLPEIKSWQRKHVDTLSVALVSRDTPEANRRKFVGLDPRRVLLQSESEVASEYQARWTPGGVVVTPGGTIGSQVAFGVEAIRSLAAHAVSDARSKPWLAAIDRQNGHSHQNGETARPSVGDL
ncbi:MAG TPA: MauE/DoxX family redox-associated membrane protein, partial [Pyrinomonadaceae bacterium]